jgi:hypothetical protein
VPYVLPCEIILRDADEVGETSKEGRMENTEIRQEMSRRGFLELGLASISGVALIFLSACGGEQDDDDEGDDDD